MSVLPNDLGCLHYCSSAGQALCVVSEAMFVVVKVKSWINMLSQAYCSELTH